LSRNHDDIFAEPRPAIEDFNFGQATTAVFDDMVDRSVPFYGEIQRMVGELTADFAAPGSRVYDLGCSTCTGFISMDKFLPAGIDVELIGIDSSEDMLTEARRKLDALKFSRRYDLRRADLHQGLNIENASVVLMNLTLQFVRPLYRSRLIEHIRAGLNDEGCLILVEKVLGEESLFNRLFIKHYYEMKKRNGYTELEISQKREALENVLIPYRLEENRELLLHAGFRHVEVFFKWYNFCGLIALA
jgi:tRNA (cmo5U34)-methyltransferase